MSKKRPSCIQRFYFKHWKDKKRAYIIYEWTGADTGGDIYIFIEPDEYREWHIIIRSTGDFRFFSEVEETVGYSLKYRRATKDDYPLVRGTYLLSVQDKNGNELENF